MSDLQDAAPFQFMHRGEGGCGGIIAFMHRRPNVGDAVASCDAVHLDGSPIGFGEAMTCGTCGRLVGYGGLPPLAYIEPRA